MGIEIHANVILNILNRNFLKHPNHIHCLIGILACSIFSALVFEMVSPLVGAIIAFIFCVLSFYYGYIAYN